VNTALVSVDRLFARKPPVPDEVTPAPPLKDRIGRPLADLRLSVTDRCNFRCGYCMPRSTLGRVAIPARREPRLDFDELAEIARVFVELGVTKLRLTGGEPLLRRELALLVARLSRLAIQDLCLTTNGSLLENQAKGLADAGLHRVTVSLDAIDERTFARMSDGNVPLAKVLAGIDAARAVGLNPVKINMVVLRGVNEHSVIPMAEWARSQGLELRYIEYMDVGCSNGWRATDVVTAEEIRERVHRLLPIEPAISSRRSETAERYRYLDGRGHMGIIASISRPFCSGCTRARVSSQGELYPCLFAPRGLDLATPLRTGRELSPIIAAFWRQRSDRYSELRTEAPRNLLRPEMSAIGG
jgi:GTP 3',8-cyclase